MSLFLCSKCQCVDNTACTTGFHPMTLLVMEAASGKPQAIEMLAHCREVLGLPRGAPLGRYCSVCTPIWFDNKGAYGRGPCQNPRAGPGLAQGMWHGAFPRQFLPKGEFEFNSQNELVRKTYPGKPEAFYRETEWPPTVSFGDVGDLHHVGNVSCSEGWCGDTKGYPFLHTGCGGLVHAAVGDEMDGYWLASCCDVCGKSVDQRE